MAVDRAMGKTDACCVRTGTITIVLPCFNEEGNIERTVRDVESWMEERELCGEIIVVNDGSMDKTGQILQRLEGVVGSLRIITHAKNLGYGAAVRTGCDAARTDLIAFMDSDGQFDPKDFDSLLPWISLSFREYPSRWEGTKGRGEPPLLNPPPKGEVSLFQVIVGRRRHRADPFLRKLNAKLFGLLSWLVLGIWVRDINCAMKVFRKDAWGKARPVVTTGALFNAEFFYNLKRAGIHWHQVDVSHYKRRTGKQTGANLRVILRMFRELWKLRHTSGKY